LEQRVPELGNRSTFKDERKAKGNHKADGDEENCKDCPAKFPIGVDAKVEDQDRDFGQTSGRDIQDYRSCSPLRDM